MTRSLEYSGDIKQLLKHHWEGQRSMTSTRAIRHPVRDPIRPTSTTSLNTSCSRYFVLSSNQAMAGDENPSARSWENEPPYKPPSQRPDFTAQHRGSCHCGRVKYSLSRDRPLASKYCHCRDCQVLHGKPAPVQCRPENRPAHMVSLPQAHRSNGPPSSTKRTWLSTMVIQGSCFTSRLRRRRRTICRARCPARTAARRLWTRGGTWRCCSRRSSTSGAPRSAVCSSRSMFSP